MGNCQMHPSAKFVCSRRLQTSLIMFCARHKIGPKTGELGCEQFEMAGQSIQQLMALLNLDQSRRLTYFASHTIMYYVAYS